MAVAATALAGTPARRPYNIRRSTHHQAATPSRDAGEIRSRTGAPWTSGQCLALGWAKCTRCHGIGWTVGRSWRQTVCACVYRRIFDICHRRWTEANLRCESIKACDLEFVPRGACSHQMYGKRFSEFIADFELVATRTLPVGELAVFRMHCLAGRDWRRCCEVLGVNRGLFFHMLYRMKARLGLAFHELRPYALYPLDEYFHTVVSKERVATVRAVEALDASRPPRVTPAAPRAPAYRLRLAGGTVAPPAAVQAGVRVPPMTKGEMKAYVRARVGERYAKPEAREYGEESFTQAMDADGVLQTPPQED